MRHELNGFRGYLQRAIPQGLRSHLAEHIKDNLVYANYRPGEIIFPQGSEAELVFWLLKGFAKLYRYLDNGDRVLVDLRGPGDILNYDTEINHQGRRNLLEARALTRCSIGLQSVQGLHRTLGEMDRDTVISLFQNLHSSSWRAYAGGYAYRSSFRMRLEIALQRIGTRFGVAERRGVFLVPRLNHEELAEMIGSSRPMVSKLVADMVEEGILLRGDAGHLIISNAWRSTCCRSVSGDERRAILQQSTSHLAKESGN